MKARARDPSWPVLVDEIFPALIHVAPATGMFRGPKKNNAIYPIRHDERNTFEPINSALPDIATEARPSGGNFCHNLVAGLSLKGELLYKLFISIIGQGL